MKDTAKVGAKIHPNRTGRVVTTTRGETEHFTVGNLSVTIDSPDGGLRLSAKPRPAAKPTRSTDGR